MKTKVTALFLLSTITLSSALRAEEVALPVVAKPSILQEGVQRELSPAQLAEMLPWAKDSKIFLVDLLDGVQSITSIDRNERLLEGIKSVVEESSKKNN